ncbi:hypothetical protein [Isoptericola sp. NPDC057653]|uniref:hypothetical protein n=1 Tax=Isoptericola sp. NPDC057653 TaxID=3346195 RepID=UPI0036A4B696
MLAKATPGQAERALADLAASGADVRLVLTARDLARELASGWQESLKFGARRTLRDFLDRAREGRSAFMRSFDPTRVLTTWGSGLPRERIHVVTAPPPGRAEDLLWVRFLDALDVDPAWVPREAARVNASVGVPEAQVLRRLNGRLGARAHRGGDLSPLVDGLVVAHALAPRRSAAITVGPDDLPWVAERSGEWVAWLRQRGVTVHGDLDDLLPEAPEGDWTDPDAPRPRQVAAAALDVVEVLLSEVHDRPASLGERLRRAFTRARG